MRAAALIALAALTACNERNAIAERVEERADDRADAMEEAGEDARNPLQRNVMDQQAETVRQAGEERADAIRESELDPDDLTAAQKNALVEGTDPPSRR